MKRLMLLLTLGALSLPPLAACNTVEGVGQDVKATGRAIEKGADGAKR